MSLPSSADTRPPPASRGPYRIDTHQHLFPPRYVVENQDALLSVAPGMPANISTDWTPQRAIEAMDKFDIAAAVLSISTPGVWFGDKAKARSTARYCNEYGARLVTDYPGRFGMFAAISLADVESSLIEIEYAFDVLKLDGVGLMTTVDGKWPGDPAFAPVFDELNRRKAVVYFHPACPPFALDLVPGIPPSILEFVFDTTRAICSLLYSGTLSRCADIRFILSHGGGTAPFLADRIASLVRRPNFPELRARIPRGVEYELGKLYYDIVSIVANPPGFNAVRKIAAASHVLFGTDFPFYRIEHAVEGLTKCELPAAELAGVNRQNALALFPRFAEAQAERHTAGDRS
jgi:predicted TIM-barrel fold metal-dependent hydrolase